MEITRIKVYKCVHMCRNKTKGIFPYWKFAVIKIALFDKRTWDVFRSNKTLRKSHRT